MLVRQFTYLITVLVTVFEKAIGRILAVMNSLRLIHTYRSAIGFTLAVLRWIDSWLVFLKRYLEQVRKTLQYRLHFEAVTQPMRIRYRELKKRKS